MTFICDQILSEITTSIIFDIAKEEGFQDEDYKSPVIDNLLREFQFWNKLIPSQIFEKPVDIPQELDIEIASSEVGDSMGLQTKMCQLIQKSTAMSPSETQFQDFPLQENFRIQPLSILQTPSISSPPAKILKARGR